MTTMQMEHKIIYYVQEIERLLDGQYVPPITCEVDPSNFCMLRCGFCFYAGVLGHNRVHLPMPLFTQVVHDLEKGGTKTITLTGGGEPLCNPKINDMAELALATGIEVGLITNGVLLNRFKHIDKTTFIRISLDSSDREMYQKVKGLDMFNRVIRNIREARQQAAVLGLSYVVCADNVAGIERAKEVANELEVDYIQFKPAAGPTGQVFEIPTLDSKDQVIVTNRQKAVDTTPCTIAHLIGVVAADGSVYFCCQQREVAKYKVGNLKETPSFTEIWKRRLGMTANFKSCPVCRYINYTNAYKEFTEGGTLFFQHRYFL